MDMNKVIGPGIESPVRDTPVDNCGTSEYA